MNRSEILDTAKSIVNGAREEQYGKAEDNFSRIGGLWSVYLEKEITAEDVAIMMCLFKIGRVVTGAGTDDSYIDLAGYAACAGELRAERRKVEGGDDF